MLKTKYKFIHFVKIADKPKTSIWSCRTNYGVEIGTVSWYASWRQYSFLPSPETVFSAGCLNDIIDFIRGLTGEKKCLLKAIPK